MLMKTFLGHSELKKFSSTFFSLFICIFQIELNTSEFVFSLIRSENLLSEYAEVDAVTAGLYCFCWLLDATLNRLYSDIEKVLFAWPKYLLAKIFAMFKNVFGQPASALIKRTTDCEQHDYEQKHNKKDNVDIREQLL
jgi:hypothetical protein